VLFDSICNINMVTRKIYFHRLSLKEFTCQIYRVLQLHADINNVVVQMQADIFRYVTCALYHKYSSLRCVLYLLVYFTRYAINKR
jgi:hypothetical protein